MTVIDHKNGRLIPPFWKENDLAVILFGHGKMEYTAGADPRIPMLVGLSPGQTLQFYCDYDQILSVSDTDVPKMANLTMPRPFRPLTSKHVVPNMKVVASAATDEADLRQERMMLTEGAKAGHVVLIPGHNGQGDINLCTNSNGTCPTEAENDKKIPENPVNKAHSCDGILGRFPREEIHWFVCARLDVAAHASKRLSADDQERIKLGQEAKAAAEGFLGNMGGSVRVGENPDDDFISKMRERLDAGELHAMAMYFEALTERQQMFLWADEQLRNKLGRYLRTRSNSSLLLAQRLDAEYDPLAEDNFAKDALERHRVVTEVVTELNSQGVFYLLTSPYLGPDTAGEVRQKWFRDPYVENAINTVLQRDPKSLELVMAIRDGNYYEWVKQQNDAAPAAREKTYAEVKEDLKMYLNEWGDLGYDFLVGEAGPLSPNARYLAQLQNDPEVVAQLNNHPDLVKMMTGNS